MSAPALIAHQKAANEHMIDRFRFGRRLHRPGEIGRSAVVQRMIDRNQWPAARMARACEIGLADEFDRRMREAQP